MRAASLHSFDDFCDRFSPRQKRSARTLGVNCFLLVLALSTGLNVWAATSASAREEQEPRTASQTINYDSRGTQISAFLAKPQGSGKHPAVIVIHDSQGLNDTIRDVARQLAAAGFVAMAPDLLSRTGGTAAAQQVESAVAGLSPLQTVEDLRAGFAFLLTDPDVDPAKISSIGFGWGGWRSFKLAATLPGLSHTVIFYGATPVDGLQNIHASVLANYAQYDFFDTGNSIWTEDTLKQFGEKFSYYVYPKTFRGFFDPDGAHYDADAAKLAWTRTLNFLKS